MNYLTPIQDELFAAICPTIITVEPTHPDYDDQTRQSKGAIKAIVWMTERYEMTPLSPFKTEPMSNEQELRKEAIDAVPPMERHKKEWIDGYITGRKATDTAKDKEIAELKERLVEVAGETATKMIELIKVHTICYDADMEDVQKEVATYLNSLNKKV